MNSRFSHIAALAALALVLSIASIGEAAAATESLDTLRQEVRTNKRAYVERTLDLTPVEAKRFWPLYDRYERQLYRIIDRQNRVVLEYVQPEKITNANARRLALELMKADTDEQKLREKQLRDVLQVLPARKAVRYIQLENRIRTVMRYDITEQMPLVE